MQFKNNCTNNSQVIPRGKVECNLDFYAYNYSQNVPKMCVITYVLIALPGLDVHYNLRHATHSNQRHVHLPNSFVLYQRIKNRVEIHFKSFPLRKFISLPCKSVTINLQYYVISFAAHSVIVCCT